MELYSEQDAETKIIVPALVKLGFSEGDPRRKVILRFRHPITVSQGREKRTIYADLVVFIDEAPLIVIDAKNPRQYLTENDKEQVISYARLIGDIAPYSALCNGHTWQVFDTVTKQQIPALPSYDNLLVDLQKRRLSNRQRESIQSQATRTLFAIDSAMELSRLMRRCHDVIRNLKGYDPTKAFDELSKLLFAKMYEEREVDEGRRTNNRFTVVSVKEMRNQGVEIIQTLWRDTVKSQRYQDVFSDQDAATEIDLPSEAIDRIVAILENRSLGLTDLDVKGVAFEEFLAATYRGGGLGQYFTPREVVNFMVELVDPTIGEKIIDPSCGSGGFLIRSYDVIREKIRSSELNNKEKDRRLKALATSTLVGIDWEPRAARTCKMNMIIHGDGHAGVYQANGLDRQEINRKAQDRQRFNPDAPSVDEGTFDIILTNPPFGASDSLPRILADFDLGKGRSSQKREVLMLERCIKLLRPGGRMAVVIPEGILSNKSDNHIRKFIRDECIIKAVIRLPQDAFKMSEGAACTSILYVIKKDPEDTALSQQGDIFFARAEYIGISPSGKPIDQNDLPGIKESYRAFEAGKWAGIEMRSIDDNDNMEIIKFDFDNDLWLEPGVNRTSLLYDRLAYVIRKPRIGDRFSYTYFHPRYYKTISDLRSMSVEVKLLESLCVEDYPRRGKKSSEESTDGIPILKVRNVTGAGIHLDVEYAPDTEETRKDCARGIVIKNDILVTSTGEGTIGRIDIYSYADDAIADGHVCICRLRAEVNPRYVLEYLRSEHGQIQILRHISGSTGQTELLQDHVKSLLVPLPDSSLQQEIVDLMDEARKRSEELRQQSLQLKQESSNILGVARQAMVKRLMS